jgi:hypothetical protein
MDPRSDHGEEIHHGSGRPEVKRRSHIRLWYRMVALTFVQEGADVFSTLKNRSRAGETVRAVEEPGKRMISAPGDTRDESHCRKVVEEAVQEFGQIDIPVNSAVYQMIRNGIREISSEQFDRAFKTSIYATYYLTKAAIPHMRPGASIINTCSKEPLHPKPSLLDYAARRGR